MHERCSRLLAKDFGAVGDCGLLVSTTFRDLIYVSL